MSKELFISVKAWEYRDTAATPPTAPPPKLVPPVHTKLPPGYTEEQVAARVQTALAEAEQHWKAQAEAQEKHRKEQLRSTLESFAEQRALYFRKAETEVVHLALAISRKIVQREATFDPDVLAALVRIALDRMGAGPAVRLRLPIDEIAAWQQRNSFAGTRYACELVPDASLCTGECTVETDLGKASLGLEAQFKEIEQGLFDLLALRPEAA